jgi:hypothetical protein
LGNIQVVGQIFGVGNSAYNSLITNFNYQSAGHTTLNYASFNIAGVSPSLYIYPLRVSVGAPGDAKDLHVEGNLTVTGTFPSASTNWAVPVGSINSH